MNQALTLSYNYNHGSPQSLTSATVDVKIAAPKTEAPVTAPASAIGDAIEASRPQQRSVVGEASARFGRGFGKFAAYLGVTAAFAGIGYATGQLGTSHAWHAFQDWPLVGAGIGGVLGLVHGLYDIDMINAGEKRGDSHPLAKRMLQVALTSVLGAAALGIGASVFTGTALLGIPAALAGGIVGCVYGYQIDKVRAERST